MNGVHDLTVVFARGYGEFRPDCSCGWTGSYWVDRWAAENEHARHLHADEAET